MTHNADYDATEHIARLITASIKGSRWRDMTPLEVARYLTEHGVTTRVIPPAEALSGNHRLPDPSRQVTSSASGRDQGASPDASEGPESARSIPPGEVTNDES
jgi:hypothetical protein